MVRAPRPEDLLRWRDSVYATDLLIVAVAWLDLFTWLGEHPTSLPGLCKGLGLAERPVDVMCTLLRSWGLLEERAGLLAPTEQAAAHFAEGGPFDLRPYYASLRERPACRELFEVLRSGSPAAWPGGTEPWVGAMEDPAVAAGLTAAMDARGSLLAPALASAMDLANAVSVLDVAGGSGIYACALVDRYPHLKATVLEKPPVDAAARTLIAQRGYRQRVDVVAGDMLSSPLPEGHDVHLYSHVLHDWGEDTVRDLIAASFAALPPGGRIVDHDAHVDADKCGPPDVAAYSVLLMHSTPGKCWSVGELKTLLKEAGFVDVSWTRLQGDRSIIDARKPFDEA